MAASSPRSARRDDSGQTLLRAASAPRALAGFFLSGVLFAFPGAILPAWRHHVSQDFLTVGGYFLSLNVGILVSLPLAARLLVRRGAGQVIALASLVAFTAFLVLAVSPAAFSLWWRMAAMFAIGGAAALLNTAVFNAVSPLYRQYPASTVNLAGALFGLGSVVIALLVAGTFHIYSLIASLLLIAVIPGLYTLLYAAKPWSAEPGAPSPPFRQALRDFRSPAAVLFTLLLFFQFGNEWSIAGWLPLFLICRLGISPESSLIMLAGYWTALLIGRIAVLAILPAVSHGKLLMGSVVAALFGTVVLAFTNNRFGAVSGILLIGFGFASVYPLVVENIGNRFPYYHPGVFNGLFSFGLTGGLLATSSLGLFTNWWGIRAVVLVPLGGTLVVLVLLLVIWAEARFG